jgi:putative sulfotransferase
LKNRLQQKIWIERSGVSAAFVGSLHTHFPDARFIHIVRDGRNCALSMKAHEGFKLFMVLLEKYIQNNPSVSLDSNLITVLPENPTFLLPENFDVQQLREYDISSIGFGYIWSAQIIAGLKALKEISREQVLTIRYEDILTDPESELRTLIHFIDPSIFSSEWITRATTLVQRPRSSWEVLPAYEKKLLTRACRHGMEALAAENVFYDF